MGNIKKWSTGPIGNDHPDHSDRSNPNTKGLDTDGFPGIEAYIEEDEVNALYDNRPLKNLAENDGIISQNVSDVASEVDNGVFKDKYDKFELSILPQDFNNDPESNEEILINTLRIGSGSGIINGQVTRIGNQKLVYFYRENDSNSILFPNYDAANTSFKIEIYDDDYFDNITERTFGKYIPVYNTLTEKLPNNFENYEINIIQRDSLDPDKRHVTIYNMYRDWEDIVPFKPHSEFAEDEVVNFESDLNFGQDSQGYWLDCSGVKNTRVSDVRIEKDIVIQDKAIKAEEFVASGTEYVKPLVTDGLFFQDLKWSSNDYFDRGSDIQDIYIDEQYTTFFVQRSNASKRLFRLSASSNQLETKDIGTTDVNIKLERLNQYLFILGTQGFISLLDISPENLFSNQAIEKLINFPATTETIRQLKMWDDKVWIVGDTSLWYTDLDTFNPQLSSFTQVDISAAVKTIDNVSIIDHINKVEQVVGNYRGSSSKINLFLNPSFEEGGIGNLPNKWILEENASGSSLKITNDYNNIGVYSAALKKGLNSTYCSIHQKIKSSANQYTLSAYVRTNITTTDLVKLHIYELDSTDGVVGSSVYEYTPTTSFERISLTHTISDPTTVSIKAEIRSEIVANTVETLYIDSAQLEEGELSDYIESFDYLVIGFKKVSTDLTNPPLAIIDKADPYNIKYTRNIYGNVLSINDLIFDKNNSIAFVDDKNIYTMTLLNNKGEYDGITIKAFFDKSNDSYHKIKKFETLKKVGTKYYYGGIVDNRVVKIEATQSGNQSILIEDAGIGNGESFIDLMDGYTYIGALDSRNAAIQFNRVEPCYDSPDNITHVGEYIPNAVYSFKITFNNDTDNSQIVSVQAPANNKAPWTIDQIRNSLASVPIITGLRWVETDVPVVDLQNPEWYKISSSVTIKEGFYSSNGKNEEVFIRGNIHNIFIKDNDLYLAKDNQIFKSKYDSNLLKIGETLTGYNWDLYNTDHTLEEYNDIKNQELIFNDDVNNHFWVDLNVGEGYSILPGSLKVKTNANTEVGYSEDIDYFVDYDNLKIIRSKNTNFLKNSSFSEKTGDIVSNWYFYSDSVLSLSKYSQQLINSDFTKYGLKIYTGSDATFARVYQKVSSQDISGVANLQSGNTYTFSVYVYSNISQTVQIRITECNDSNADLFTNQAYSGNNVLTETVGKWQRISVSHTVSSSSSTILRVEIASSSFYQLTVCKPMLEKNPAVTPYVEGIKTTTISADSHVWLDYTRIKTLSSGTEYVFDTVNRSVNLINSPNASSTYFLKYKYSKIFNAYKFGDARPTTDVVDTTDDDDYFLFELEGKIWAINQNFAVLSLDEDNPIRVSYKYSYPRIDQLKIRNSPDKYGNYLYFVQGTYHKDNPYKPIDVGLTKDRYIYNTDIKDIANLDDLNQLNNIDNDVLYEINVTSNDFTKNDIYDRRIYIDAKTHKLFNISLYPETVAYFPFLKDFNSTNGLVPLNELTKSKIVPIIKNYTIIQNSELGAYRANYQYVLRNNPEMITPQASYTIFVDPLEGLDTNSGESKSDAIKTLKHAVSLLNEERCNIVITRNSIISENIEIDKPFPIKIFADTYCYWKGGLQNISEVSIQGIWFKNTNIYCSAKINIFFCTFENTSFNCVKPQTITVYNSEFKNCHNSIVRVKDTLFPSPFKHPYQKFELRDDGITGSPSSVATSMNESIAPGDSFYDASQIIQPRGAYTFDRCLIHDSSDVVIHYDPKPDWISSFTFKYSTIANNNRIIDSQKYTLSIDFENCILYKNSAKVSNDPYIFTTNSDITFYNSFIDFSALAPSSDYNDGNGVLLNREACYGKEDDANPDFIGMILNEFDYHLKAIAKGSSVDSICLNKGAGGVGDIGVYDESRKQQDKGLPQKLRTYVAYIAEGVAYPVRLNSEKITFTLEFKPTGSISQSGIVLDTRSASDDEDYIVLAYNNNLEDDHSLIQNPTNSVSNPYRFRVILANKEKSYSVVSPIEIYTDEQFQAWHKISFTINYEEIYTSKSNFIEKDRKQNIITLYHNDTINIESFVKYDLNRYVDGELIVGRGNVGTNSWNYNEISQFITLGADCNNLNKMIGYYTELRIDNRFIDRKQFEMWNEKAVPFNDPMSYVNQSPLARTLDTRNLSEYWSLKSKSNVGAKGTPLASDTYNKVFYNNGEIAWAVTEATNNMCVKGAFTNVSSAAAVADGIIVYPITLESGTNGVFNVKTIGSLNVSDNTTGVSFNLVNELNGTKTFASRVELDKALQNALSIYTNSLINYEFTQDGKLRFYTKDFTATEVVIYFNMSSATTYSSLGYSARTKSGIRTIEPYVVEGQNASIVDGNHVWTEYDSEKTLFNSNVLFVEKSSSSLTEDIVRVSQNVAFEIGDYAYSCYIYSNENVNIDTVKMILDLAVVDFDSVEKYYGNCWICKKTIKTVSANASGKVGTAFFNKGVYAIAGMQLENKTFVGPFSEIHETKNGKIVVPKNIINSSAGVLAFRFNPLFSFYETDEKYLMETVGLDGDNLVVDQGFRVSYHYNVRKRRGIVKFSINDTASVWELEVVERFWNQWHTIIINYDFNTKRFVFWFDYYSNIVDDTLSEHNLSNLYIGKGVDGDREVANRVANILVKDIIVSDYPITDTESQNWVNSYEFFNESLIVNTIDKYKSQVETYVNVASNATEYINNLSSSVAILNNHVGSLDTQTENMATDIASIETEVATLSSTVSSSSNSVAGLTNLISGFNTTLKEMQDGNTSRWSPSLVGSNLYELSEGLETLSANLASESSYRTAGDNTIRSQFASTDPVSSGGKLVGIAPSTQFASTDIESALKELAGSGRTTETVYSLQQQIDVISGSSSSSTSSIELMKDGGTGIWTAANAQNNGWNIASLKEDVVEVETAISDMQGSIAITNAATTNEISRLDGRIDGVYTDLSSTDVGSGSSLVGFDNGTTFSASNVEAALKELAGPTRNSSMTVSSNYTSISIINDQISDINGRISDINENVVDIPTMKDGGDGSTWTDVSWNLVSHENRLNTLNTSVTDLFDTVDAQTTAIDSAVTRVGAVETGLTQEIAARQNTFNLIKSTAVNEGASLVGINDSDNNFTSITVEGALRELSDKVGALSGSLSWKSAVASYNDLPITGNTLNDARTVQSDGDGKQAQYVCISITGTVADQWIKIADVDWGHASSIVYDNTISNLEASSVQEAITEIALKSNSSAKHEATVSAASWIEESGEYTVTIAHGLKTINVSALVQDSNTGMIVGVSEIERVDSNTVKLYASSAFDASVVIFGVVDRISMLVNNWVPNGSGEYYIDIIHNFGTKAIMTSVFDTITYNRISLNNVEYLDDNTIRLHSSNNNIMNVYITKNAQYTFAKDLYVWAEEQVGMYYIHLDNVLGYDAIYNFFDVVSGKTVEINEVRYSSGVLTISKTTPTPIRLVILQ